MHQLIERAELPDMSKAITTPHDGPRTIVISGAPGTGKSTLAVQVAHRCSNHFPDGQLYLNLLGTAPERPPLTSTEAAEALLEMLGARPGQMVTPERAATFVRDILSDRQLLIILDDAASVGQVRPLLPLGSRTTVVLTSRTRLASLPGTHLVTLGSLSTQAAVALLRTMLTDGRIERDAPAVARLIHLCGHLALPLRIAAARLAARPGWSVSDMVDRLGDEDRRLDELRVEGLDLRAILGVSLRALRDVDDEQQSVRRTFHALGQLPTSHIDLSAVTGLLGQPRTVAEAAIEQLVDLNLVESPTAGSYHLNPLIKLFALQQSMPSRGATDGRHEVAPVR
ncbi:AAA family ATPase [Micromonospora sp. NPDC047134]|uniref:AAA family ATPase n=1 Tax=Micromonospora sp. NPDC047134 TaxID=3154340 RepID=UPI0033FB3A25